MALREFTLSNMMIWGAGAMLAVGGAGAGATAWLGQPKPVPVVALAALVPVALPAIAAAPILPATPHPELPKLRPAAAKPRPAARAPAPPRVVPQVARIHTPSPVAPSYAPSARWQQTYVATQYPMPYYAYAPRYGEYLPYPGY